MVMMTLFDMLDIPFLLNECAAFCVLVPVLPGHPIINTEEVHSEIPQQDQGAQAASHPAAGKQRLPEGPRANTALHHDPLSPQHRTEPAGKGDPQGRRAASTQPHQQ